MHATGESDESVIPTTPTNNDATEAFAESAEERDSVNRNAVQPAHLGHRAELNVGHADCTACVKLLEKAAQFVLLPCFITLMNACCLRASTT